MPSEYRPGEELFELVRRSAMPDVFNHLDPEVQRRMRELVPDDLGDYDDEVEQRVSTMGASTLIEDIRRSQCLRGQHRFTTRAVEDGGIHAVRVCEHCDLMQTHNVGRAGWFEVRPCKYLPQPEIVELPFETYRSVPVEPEPPTRSWWQRFVAWCRGS